MKNCTVCNKQFQPGRADQKFCSKACKQKDYRKQTLVKVYKDIEAKPKFSLSEYNSFIEMYGWDREMFPFILFCFYRRLLPTCLNGERLYEGISDLVPDLRYQYDERECLYRF